MPPTFPTSYNATELDRILSTLKDTKLTLTFKLNLLRSSATGSPTHLTRFNALENQLVHVGEQIWMMDANFDRNKTGLSLSQKNEYEEGIKQSLKKGMEVVGTLDTLGEDIMRLKFTMEAMPVAGGKGAIESVSAVGGQEGGVGASRVNFASATGAMLSGLLAFTAAPQAPPSAAPSSCSGDSSSATNGSASTLSVSGHANSLPAVSRSTDGGPVMKKQRPNPAPNDQSPASASKDNEVKQDPNVPKPVKVTNWAPEGYYFVKAHFRRKPNRKAKQTEVEEKRNGDKAPASVEIVDLDGV